MRFNELDFKTSKDPIEREGRARMASSDARWRDVPDDVTCIRSLDAVRDIRRQDREAAR